MEAAAQRHGIAACPSLDDMLALPGLQAVIVTMETSMHADIVEKAAAAGKIIVLQKPMALTIAQADPQQPYL